MTHEAPVKENNWFDRHKMLAGLGAIVVLVLVIAFTRITTGSSGIGGNSNSGGDKVAVPASTTKDVTEAPPAATSLTFEIAGTARKGIVTWIGDKFSTSQDTEATFPWKKTVKYTSATHGVTVSAANSGPGAITCAIKENGKTIATNSSQGRFAVVSCSVP
jgi:hypothetical protein